MLIPSIDLMNGRVVQLEQGERLVFESDNLDEWIAKFAAYPLVQVIDLDAAMNRGDNFPLVCRVLTRLPCQVGGGLRTIERAQQVLAAGATRVILGSVLFHERGVDLHNATMFAGALGRDRIVGAVDSRGGRVVTQGWKSGVPITPVEAVIALEPHVGAFLYTQVDTEGTLRGLRVEPVLAVQAATTRPIIAAGGIRRQEEIDALHARGIDAVVGMAVYRGLLRT